MKALTALIFSLCILAFTGCWNMYNDVAGDMEENYNYYLASADTSGGNIRTFQISTDGIPDFNSEKITSTGATSYYPAVHPNGKYLYIPDYDNDQLLMYSVNKDGSLTPLGSPNYITTGIAPYCVKIHPSGKFAYVANWTSGTITVFDINSDGSLVNNSTYSTGISPRRLRIHPSGGHLYTVCGTGGSAVIYSSAINSDGSLAAPVIAAPTYPYSSNITDMAITPNGKYIYVTRDDGFDKYNITSSEDIDISSRYSVTLTDEDRGYLAINSEGTHLYFASYSTIYAYRIISNGEVSFINQVSFTGGQTYDFIIHPKKNYLYVSDYGNNHIYYLSINNDETISLSPISYSVSTYGLVLIRQKK